MGHAALLLSSAPVKIRYMATANPACESMNQYRPKNALATAEIKKHTNAPIKNTRDEKLRPFTWASSRQCTTLLS